MRFVLLFLLALLSGAHATTIPISVGIVNPLAFTQTTPLNAPVSTSTVVGTISGGVAPYTLADVDLVYFSVSGSNLLAAATLAAGQYPATITDSGSQQLHVNVSVGVGNAITYTPTKVLVAPVAIGTTVGTINGGVQPYTVNDTTHFATGAGNLNAAATLAAGSYPVTITDNAGTTVSATVVVLPVLGFAQVEPLVGVIAPGTTVGTISGGTAPYSVADTTHFSVSGTSLLAAASLTNGSYATTLNDSGGQSLAITVVINAPVTFTAVQPLAAPVAAGTLVGTISGGTTPYSVNDTTHFTVSGGNLLAATTLTAGNYPITISDAVPNTVNATIAVHSGVAFAQVNPLVATVPVGTIVGNIAGGATPYHVADTAHFSIVNTTQLAASAPLAAGSYPTTLTDSSNQSQAITVLVETPVVVTQSTTLTSALAVGANAATISGGVAPYTVNDPGHFTVSGANLNLAVALAPGSYPVIVTDSLGATGSAAFTVYAPLSVQVIGSLIGPLAPGTTVAVISGGFGPYTVSDATDFVINGTNVQTVSTLQPGSYAVIVADSAVPHALSAAVTIPVQVATPPLTFAQVGLTAPVPFDALIGTIAGGVPPYSVSDTVNFAVDGSALDSARALSAGSYPVTITDSVGGSVTSTIAISATVSSSVVCNQIGALTAPLAANTTICMIVVLPSTWTSPPGTFQLSGNNAGQFYVNGYAFKNSVVLGVGVYTVILASVP